MKVGQFVTLFPSCTVNKNERIYGSTRAAYDLSINLAKLGHEITTFTTSKTFVDSIEYQKNIKICRYGSQIKLYSTRISAGMFYKPTKSDLDIIHVHFDIPPGPFAGLAVAKKTKKPLIVTYHGDWDDTYGSLFRKKMVSFFNIKLVDELLSYSDKIITPSENYIEESRFLKKYACKIVVIPNGVNKKHFETALSKEECRKMLNLPADCKIILFLGALNLRKGPDILLRSMVDVLKEIPNSRLIFIGDGNFKNELKLIAKKLELEKSVNFIGYIDEELKPYYYKASDVFVLPSTISTEVFPLVLLEAMASATPIITSDLRTFQDIIKNGETGLISKKGDPKDLSFKIIQVLKDKDLGVKLSRNGIKCVATYSWEEIAKMTDKLYQDIYKE